jgi:hypothetical protein
MKEQETPITQPEAATAPAPATPAHGGSYVVDEKTGEHVLVERTQEKAKE